MRAFIRLLGIVVLLAGWGVLVVLAVMSSTSGPFGWTAVFTAGAMACLFLALLAWSRLRAVRRGEVPARRTPSHRA